MQTSLREDENIMEKTKLGISVGALGAIVYFAGLINGLLLVSIIAGYILLKEENIWLKKTALSSIILTVVFAILPKLICLIPDFIGMLDSFVTLFGGSIITTDITTMQNILCDVVYIVEVVVMFVCAILAFKGKSLSLPGVDSIVKKFDN